MSLHKEIPNGKNLKLVLREYKPKDSNDLIELENEASQIPFTIFGLVNVGKIFSSPFDQKCKKYKDHIILVVEHIKESGKSRICAGASLGIKDIYFNQKIVKAGYLFDLRVSQYYQRLGIGQALSQYLEDMAKSKGCDMLFLGVNKTNPKAIGLYEKMGFLPISDRKMYFESVRMDEIQPPVEKKTVLLDGRLTSLVFKREDDAKALDYTTQFYKSQDLAPKDMNELVGLSCFEGTYTISTEDGASVVGVSLVKSSNENTMGLKKLIVPAHQFLQRWCNGLFIAIVLACLMPLIFYLDHVIKEAVGNTYLGDFLTILIFVIITWVVLVPLLTAFDFMKQFAGYAGKGRIVAPFEFGDTKNSEVMFEALREELLKICRAKNIQSIILNIDANDKISSKFESKLTKRASRSLFMAKTLNSSTLINPRKPTEHMYFDARDF